MEKYTDRYAGYIIHELKIAIELTKIGYSHSLSDYEKDVMFAAIMQRLQMLQKNIEKHYTEEKGA